MEKLDSTPLSKPCEKCGYLFLHHTKNKIDATMLLLQSDPKAVAFLKAEKHDELNAYIKEKTGL